MSKIVGFCLFYYYLNYSVQYDTVHDNGLTSLTERPHRGLSSIPTLDMAYLMITVFSSTIQHSSKDVGVPPEYRIRRAVNTSKEKVSPGDRDLVIEYPIGDWRNMVFFLIGEVDDLEKDFLDQQPQRSTLGAGLFQRFPSNTC